MLSYHAIPLQFLHEQIFKNHNHKKWLAIHQIKPCICKLNYLFNKNYISTKYLITQENARKKDNRLFELLPLLFDLTFADWHLSSAETDHKSGNQSQSLRLREREMRDRENEEVRERERERWEREKGVVNTDLPNPLRFCCCSWLAQFDPRLSSRPTLHLLEESLWEGHSSASMTPQVVVCEL